MVTISSWVFGVIISLIGLLFAVAGFYYSRVKSAMDVAQERGIILTKLDNMAESIKGIVSAQNTQTAKCAIHGERMAVMEQSTKSAHHRIDTLESRLTTVERSQIQTIKESDYG